MPCRVEHVISYKLSVIRIHSKKTHGVNEILEDLDRIFHHSIIPCAFAKPTYTESISLNVTDAYGMERGAWSMQRIGRKPTSTKQGVIG
jgi:hypothetical protein